jgi:hypothetical protein
MDLKRRGLERTGEERKGGERRGGERIGLDWVIFLKGKSWKMR